jgi:hypothetical protein
MAGTEGVDINAVVMDLRAKRAELIELLRKVDQALEAFDDLGTAPMAAPARMAGKWRPGGRGRPPKAYVEKQAKTESVTKKPAKQKARRKGKKRPPTEKQLAAMAKAREALAAKRAAAK